MWCEQSIDMHSNIKGTANSTQKPFTPSAISNNGIWNYFSIRLVLKHIFLKNELEQIYVSQQSGKTPYAKQPTKPCTVIVLVANNNTAVDSLFYPCSNAFRDLHAVVRKRTPPLSGLTVYSHKQSKKKEVVAHLKHVIAHIVKKKKRKKESSELMLVCEMFTSFYPFTKPPAFTKPESLTS